VLPALGWFLLAASAATGLCWWPLFFCALVGATWCVMSIFKINPAPTVVARIERPTEDGGVAVLEVKCKYLARAERMAWLERFAAEPQDVLLLELALGWNVADDAGQALPLDLPTLQRLLGNFETLARDWVNAYVQACAEARAKN
jgi:hypothetical protein